MTNDGEVWKKMATKYRLVEPDLSRVASPWHTDLDMGRPIEVMTDMALSRKLGFHVYQNTEEAFHDLFATLRAEKVIPYLAYPPPRLETSRWMAAAERRAGQSRSRRLTGDEGREDREDLRQPGPPAIG